MDATKIASDLEDDATDLDVLQAPNTDQVSEAVAGEVTLEADDGRTVVVRGANPALITKLKQNEHHRCSGVEIDQPL